MLTVADTAFSIAVVRADEAALREEERLFSDPYAALFAKAGDHAREGTERYLTLPFFRDAIRLRTRFIDDCVREALREGARQVVLLGAGFDARALRLPEVTRDGVTVFEIDGPEQLERKRAILTAAGVVVPAFDVFVPFAFGNAPLEPALTDALVASGFRREERAIFVWEGVIGYIDRAAIDESLRFMARAGGAGSRLVFTFGEGTFWPDTTHEALERTGFSQVVEEGLDRVWPRYLAGEPHAYASAARMGTAVVAPT